MLSSTQVVVTDSSRSAHRDEEVEVQESNSADRVTSAVGYPPNAVFLNVYDISELNACLTSIGLGAHHAGVEVYGTEYAFGACLEGPGVMRNVPRLCPPHILREQLALGVTTLTEEEVMALVHRLSTNPEWLGSRYSLLRHNCLHFAEAFLVALHPAPPAPALSATCLGYYSSTPLSEVLPLRRLRDAAFNATEEAQQQHWKYVPSYVCRLQDFVLNYIPDCIRRKIESEMETVNS